MRDKYRVFIIVMVLALCLGVTGFVGYKLANMDKVSQVDASVGDEADIYKVKSYVTQQMKDESPVCATELCLVEEFTPEKLERDADSIAIVSIISLDGSDPEGSIVGTTNGKLLVNNVLAGNLKEGQVINYSKPGGMMKMSEWEKSQPEAATQKRKYLREKYGVNIDLDNTYINVLVGGDIEIEAGKTYLAYLKENSSGYEIIGLGVGLR